MAIRAMDVIQSLVDSPLSDIASEDLSTFCASPGFQALRRYLQGELAASFCNKHTCVGDTERSAWILQRDILHAMTIPVVQLFNRASSLAFSALYTSKPEDLELAFSGDARSAFLWLQCFISEEEGWCHTRGCPACLISQIVSTESTIRFTLASSLLSSTEPPSPIFSSSPADSPSLPDFSAVLPSLKRALDDDQFWGPSYYEEFLSKSQRLASGIHDIMSQCEQLEALVSSRSTSPVRPRAIRRVVTVNIAQSTPTIRVPNGTHTDNQHGEERKEIKLKKSRLAKRQSQLKHEEREQLLRMASQCWATTAIPAEQRVAMRALGRHGDGLEGRNHKRTLTCP